MSFHNSNVLCWWFCGFILVHICYSFGPLLSTVTVFFSPPFENPVIELSKAPLPDDDGGGGGGAAPGAGGGGAPAGGGGGTPIPGAGGGGGTPGAGGAEIIERKYKYMIYHKQFFVTYSHYIEINFIP
jgi:hypothetical protein